MAVARIGVGLTDRQSRHQDLDIHNNGHEKVDQAMLRLAHDRADSGYSHSETVLGLANPLFGIRKRGRLASLNRLVCSTILEHVAGAAIEEL